MHNQKAKNIQFIFEILGNRWKKNFVCTTRFERSTNTNYSFKRRYISDKARDTKRNNTTAAKTIAEIVRSSLGPRGMDKMLVSPIGDVTITNDGATILKEIDTEHPAAKMIVEISKTTNNEAGDGTTSAVVLAGSLLEKAEELIDKKVHPTAIVEGFKKATAKAIDTLKETAIKVDSQYNDFLNKISVTSMASKTLSGDARYLSKIVADSILAITDKISADKIKAIEQPLTAYILLQSIFFVSP